MFALPQLTAPSLTAPELLSNHALFASRAAPADESNRQNSNDASQTSKNRRNDHALLIPQPKPSKQYLNLAHQALKRANTSRPRKLLVILDLNGTLLHRRSHGSAFTPRPGVKNFLDYLFEHHHVMIWSSATPRNVGSMCEKLFTPEQHDSLIAVWDRNSLRLSEKHYNMKVQVYKQLEWVWNDQQIRSKLASGPSSQRSHLPDQRNTVLIDDSVEKAAHEPYNILAITEFKGNTSQGSASRDVGSGVAQGGSTLLDHVVKYLEVLKWQENVSAYMREKPFDEDESEEGIVGKQGSSKR